MKSTETDTIAAIITPLGEGGVAVLRMSGPESFAIADLVIQCQVKLSDAATQTVHFGRIADEDGTVVDEALATVFRAPHSYTTEDIVEISCHGSVFLAGKVLKMLLKKGARLAGPGEFTRRAFLNGRIDLAQAEAVADLIRANSEASRTLAIAQLRGSLSRKVDKIRGKIVDLCSLLEVELDFSEEDLEFIERGKLSAELNSINADLTQLIDSFEFGKIYREGYRVVLVGSPNVGKSSILNALVRETRAIVTEISGTTRDTLEESVSILGVNFNIIDTAGLRSTEDLVEREGIKRTLDQIEFADLILLIVDSAKDITTQGDIKFTDQYLQNRSSKNIVVVINKSDQVNQDVIKSLLSKFPGFEKTVTSAKTGQGMSDLESLIHLKATESTKELHRETVLVSTLRQKEKLEETRESLMNCLEAIGMGVTSELLALDLRQGLHALSQVVGEDISEEVLNNVFSRFCIGK